MIEKQLDILVQKVCQTQKCRVCGKTPSVGHHIIKRANKLFRWDIINILPVCQEHHQLIHLGKIKEQPLMPDECWQYLQENKNKSYKQFLLENRYTEKEYLLECKERLEKLCK